MNVKSRTQEELKGIGKQVFVVVVLSEVKRDAEDSSV